jgi:lipoate-protein ligase A
MRDDVLGVSPVHILSGEMEADEEAAWLSERLSAAGSDIHVLITRYRSPALILGRGQATRWDHAELRRLTGMPVVLRASGGGVVLAGPWLVSLSVVLPVSHPLASAGLYEAYRWFGLLHEQVMDRCGLRLVARAPATLPPRRVDDPLDGVCFASLSPWEVTHGDRKVCGLAQVRRQRAVALVAGTHVVPPPWDCLTEAFNCPDLGPRMNERAVDMATLGSTVTAVQLADLWAEHLDRATVE